MAGVRCFVALGANLGDPVATIRAALAALRELPQAKLVAASSLYRTAPVGLTHQPDFINAVVEMRAVSPAPTFRRVARQARLHAWRVALRIFPRFVPWYWPHVF